MRAIASFAVVAATWALTGCPGTSLDVLDARARLDDGHVAVDVDLAANTDIEGHCVRVSFWNEDTLGESWLRCSGELEVNEVRTYSFRIKHDGSSCTTYTIETEIALDEDERADIPVPPQKKPAGTTVSAWQVHRGACPSAR